MSETDATIENIEPEDRNTIVLKSHCIQLSEHFDSVQIIVTRHDEENARTLKASHASGNWYANFGAVCEWVDEKREQARMNCRESE